LLSEKNDLLKPNDLLSGIHCYKFPVDPYCILPNSFVKHGDAHLLFGLQWGSQTSYCLANGPCWASRSCATKPRVWV